jgi:ParB/RepB/Spo0J family partition protein
MPANPSKGSRLSGSSAARPSQRNPFRSLISTAPPGEELQNARRLPLDLIDVNPYQSRQQFDEDALEELAASIREHDVLQPIAVIHSGERYRIVFGERRYRAAVMAEKADIPAIIYEDMDESDAAVLTALENLQREDLDLEDEARQFAYLLEVTGLSQRGLAERLGKTHNYISRRVRLLREKPHLFAAIREGLVTQRDALDLLADDRNPYHGDTEEGEGSVYHRDTEEGDEQPEGGRQVGVYQADTLVALISMDEQDLHASRTPRYEMPVPRPGIPARWQAISRTYRVLGKIRPDAVPIEECEDLAKQLEDLEALVATTRRALQQRAHSSSKNSAPAPANDAPEAASLPPTAP